MRNPEFEQFVLSKVREGEPFQPMTIYDPDSDCIEFFAADESFYAEPVDELVTVYYGMESNEIVGSLIKGVSRFIKEILKRAPNFRVEIQDGKIKLVHLFTAGLWGATGEAQETRSVIYQKLREVAQREEVEADIEDLALA